MGKKRVLLNKNTIISILGVATILVLFILASFIVHTYESEINMLAERGGAFGMIAYIFIVVLAIVIAPISTVPLIPIASGLWGWFVAGVLSIAGWAIGAQIAFHLARRFGKPLVEKLISIEKLNKFEEQFSKEHIFWTIVFLRIIIPVDILSYAIGLFSNIKSGTYTLATIIGITPFAFLIAYSGTLNVWFQLTVLLTVSIIFTGRYIITKIISTHRHGK